MVKLFLFVFLCAFALTTLVCAQDQSGFISIDCGISENTSYIDATTGIYYVSDAAYTETGVSKTISPAYKTNSLEQQFSNVRSFPEGIKNCYTLTPPHVKATQYLVRARFMYGNYDSKSQVPKFDLYLGVSYWDTIALPDESTVITKEIIYVPSLDYIFVCLINTGDGTPFISDLELRLMRDDIYKTDSGQLGLWHRFDLRSYSENDQEYIRYKDDIYDRIWEPPFEWGGVSELSTLSTIGDKHQNSYELPSIVMKTGVTPQNASQPLNFYWKPLDPDTKYYMYFHFADLQFNQSREFDIYLNDILWYGPVQPDYLDTITIYSGGPRSGTWFNFSLQKTNNSTLPPILNALEIYNLYDLSDPETDQEDVDAIKNIKSTYGVKKNWQGDPCTPKAYSWEGLNCSYGGTYDPPRITSLDLSLSGLTGKISPSIFNLKLLQYLDLSNNSLTGVVPDFLSQMQKLTILNLTGNNLTGSVPVELIERSKSGSLSLRVEGNPNLCTSNPCEGKQKEKVEKKKKKKKRIVVPIVASVAAVSVLLIAFAVLWMCILKWRKPRQQQVASVTTSKVAVATGSSNKDAALKSKNQHFTYSEILKITKNFQRVIGKGGFGTVYHGYINDAQVAVKMLSLSSVQGYKQFKAEAKLLTRVHHKNLTSLVGYCEEGNNLGLIYEYMANGNLNGLLSDNNPNILSWETRLQIALDAALGLEYLHSGCKPSIIHRDVKSTNILLNDIFQAKLADFGLSRVFPLEGGGATHVSTAVAGTPGYLDPEYYASYKLNEKSDVYSFGVVLMEIITNRPPIARTREKTHISQWVSHMLKTKGDIINVADPKLCGNFDLNSVWKASEVAVECLSPTSVERPTVTYVVMELKECLAMERARLNKGFMSESIDSAEMFPLNIETRPRGR